MKRALVIKANQLGDSIVNLPAVEALVHLLGRTNVGVITTPIAADLYLELLPRENRLVVSRDGFNQSWRHPVRFFSIWNWIRHFQPDGILIPYDQGYAARLLAKLGWRRTIVEMHNPKAGLPPLFSIRIKPDENLNMHRNDWELFKRFSAEFDLPEAPRNPPRPVMSWGFDAGCWKQPHKVLIHPGSSREATRWGEERYVALAERLAAAGVEVLWMNESKILPEANGKITILDRKPLLEFAKTVSDCSLFIGNNSGPMHLCDALNVPLLILCGPVGTEWDPYWSQQRKLIRTVELDCQPCETRANRVTHCPRVGEPFACMSRVTVEYVFRKAMDMLSPFH